jgi:hypothetical protein
MRARGIIEPHPTALTARPLSRCSRRTPAATTGHCAQPATPSRHAAIGHGRSEVLHSMRSDTPDRSREGHRRTGRRTTLPMHAQGRSTTDVRLASGDLEHRRPARRSPSCRSADRSAIPKRQRAGAPDARLPLLKGERLGVFSGVSCFSGVATARDQSTPQSTPFEFPAHLRAVKRLRPD